MKRSITEAIPKCRHENPTKKTYCLIAANQSLESVDVLVEGGGGTWTCMLHRWVENRRKRIGGFYSPQWQRRTSWRGHSNHPKGRQCPTIDTPTQDRTDRNQRHPNQQAKATRTEKQTDHQTEEEGKERTEHRPENPDCKEPVKRYRTEGQNDRSNTELGSVSISISHFLK